jgi:hypothetical protein
VVDASYQTVGPVEEWLEAHRHLWSPNTVRGYATSLAQWWTFWSAPKLPDSPSNRMDVWKGEVIAPTEEELLSRIQG